MTDIFLPLRANCGWFTSSDTHAVLARNLKNNLLFYDRIHFEDGRYRATFGPSGSFDMMLPPGSIDDRSQVAYRTPGSQFSLRLAPTGENHATEIMGGAIAEAYEVDFWPLAIEAGIASSPFVIWENLELTPEGKREAMASVRAAQYDDSLLAVLPDNRGIRSAVTKSLHEDALKASGLDLPFATDLRMAAIISRGNAATTASWPIHSTSRLAHEWLNLGLLDAADLEWSEVLRIRESAAGADLRRVFSELSESAVKIMTSDGNDADFQDVVRRLLVHEIVAETQKRKTSAAKVAVNFGLNLLPFAGMLSSGKDAYDFLRDRRSWISLLG